MPELSSEEIDHLLDEDNDKIACERMQDLEKITNKTTAKVNAEEGSKASVDNENVEEKEEKGNADKDIEANGR